MLAQRLRLPPLQRRPHAIPSVAVASPGGPPTATSLLCRSHASCSRSVVTVRKAPTQKRVEFGRSTVPWSVAAVAVVARHERAFRDHSEDRLEARRRERASMDGSTAYPRSDPGRASNEPRNGRVMAMKTRTS